MKLVRYGHLGQEKPGVLIDGIAYDTSSLVNDYNEEFFSTDGLEKLMATPTSILKALPTFAEGERIGCPVARPSKIVCIGLNYREHAAETGAAIPLEPVIFFKSTTALMGPNDQVVIPRNSVKTDWEVELAVVIGKKASYVEEAQAMDYVAGYCLHNDISEREFQLERGGTWDKGKGCDTFAPIGPWLVTKDEVADPNNLKLWLTLNGKKVQDGTTSNFIFNIAQIISSVSSYMTLLPGDIISTGTPAGVGLGMNPQLYLKPGDVMELGINGLGTSSQTCVAYKE